MVARHLKIGIIVNTYPPEDISGVGELARELHSTLPEFGIHMTVLTRGTSKHNEIDVIRRRVPKFIFPFLAPILFFSIILREKFDIIHLNDSDGVAVGLLISFLRLLGLSQSRIIVTFQVSYVKEFKAVRKLRIKGNTIACPTYSEIVFKWLRCPIHIICGFITAKLSSRIIVPSKVIGYEIVEDYLADPKKIKVVNNGVSLDSLEVGTDEDPELCLHIPDGNIVFVFVGRFRIRKGVQYIVEAFNRVRAKIDKVTLILIGTGEQEDAIKKMVTTKGLADLVLFTGKLSRRQIFRFFDFCHVFVLASLYEGLPFTILEAMLYGLPVCASKVSGNPEVVRHGETGFLHRSENIEKLTEHMKELALNPGLREAMGNRGRQLALEKFSHRKMAECYSKEYYKALEM